MRAGVKISVATVARSRRPNNVAGIDGLEQEAGLLRRDFRGLALDDPKPLPPHQRHRVEWHGMPQQQRVEEPSQGGQMLLFRGDVGGMLVEILPDQAGDDPPRLQPLRFAPGWKAPDWN
jgi:hypothetical protein